jgi:hypothetical protein
MKSKVSIVMYVVSGVFVLAGIIVAIPTADAVWLLSGAVSGAFFLALGHLTGTLHTVSDNIKNLVALAMADATQRGNKINRCPQCGRFYPLTVAVCDQCVTGPEQPQTLEEYPGVPKPAEQE